jgi:hypothetical protein
MLQVAEMISRRLGERGRRLMHVGLRPPSADEYGEMMRRLRTYVRLLDSSGKLISREVFEKMDETQRVVAEAVKERETETLEFMGRQVEEVNELVAIGDFTREEVIAQSKEGRRITVEGEGGKLIRVRNVVFGLGCGVDERTGKIKFTEDYIESRLKESAEVSRRSARDKLYDEYERNGKAVGGGLEDGWKVLIGRHGMNLRRSRYGLLRDDKGPWIVYGEDGGEIQIEFDEPDDAEYWMKSESHKAGGGTMYVVYAMEGLMSLGPPLSR